MDRYVEEYKSTRPAHSIASSIRSVSATGNSNASAHGSVISDTCSETSSNHPGSSSLQRTHSLHHSSRGGAGGALESEECSIYGSGTTRSKRHKNATTIVSLYGPGGIGIYWILSKSDTWVLRM